MLKILIISTAVFVFLEFFVFLLFHLLKKKFQWLINSDDINVIIQWSGLYRPTLYSEIESHCDLPFTEIRDEFYTLDNVSKNSGEFINTAGQIRRENPLRFQWIGWKIWS